MIGYMVAYIICTFGICMIFIGQILSLQERIAKLEVKIEILYSEK